MGDRANSNPANWEQIADGVVGGAYGKPGSRWIALRGPCGTKHVLSKRVASRLSTWLQMKVHELNNLDLGRVDGSTSIDELRDCLKQDLASIKEQQPPDPEQHTKENGDMSSAAKEWVNIGRGIEVFASDATGDRFIYIRLLNQASTTLIMSTDMVRKLNDVLAPDVSTKDAPAAEQGKSAETAAPAEVRPPPEHADKLYHWLMVLGKPVPAHWQKSPERWLMAGSSYSKTPANLVREFPGVRYMGIAEWNEPGKTSAPVELLPPSDKTTWLWHRLQRPGIIGMEGKNWAWSHMYNRWSILDIPPDRVWKSPQQMAADGWSYVEPVLEYIPEQDKPGETAAAPVRPPARYSINGTWHSLEHVSGTTRIMQWIDGTWTSEGGMSRMTPESAAANGWSYIGGSWPQTERQRQRSSSTTETRPPAEHAVWVRHHLKIEPKAPQEGGVSIMCWDANGDFWYHEHASLDPVPFSPQKMASLGWKYVAPVTWAPTPPRESIPR